MSNLSIILTKQNQNTSTILRKNFETGNFKDLIQATTLTKSLFITAKLSLWLRAAKPACQLWQDFKMNI